MQVYHPAHCFLVLPVLLVISTASAQVIHDGPQNITVFQNHPANFTCVVEGGTTGWRLNKTLKNALSSDVRDNIEETVTTDRGYSVATLTINAIAAYNGTTVQCVTFGPFQQQSETVTMTIQGPVSEVGDLKLAESSTSITISWSPPFSLIPDISYSVFIYNVTDENNPTAILCTNCTNNTETHYTFTPDYPSPCHAYNFTVIPFNGAGQGNSSLNVTGYALENHNLSVTFIGEALPDGKYRFKAKGDTNNVCTYKFQNISGQSIQPSWENETTIVFELAANEKYSIFAEIQNAAGENKTEFNFSTFDIQNVSVKSTGSTVVISLSFISGTRARGGFVVFRCKDKPCREFRAVLRPATDTTVTRNITNIPSEVYGVNFYDLEENGLPSMSPAYELSDDVIVTAEGLVVDEASSILKYAHIRPLNASAVTIDCQFRDGAADTSCVLIYQANNVDDVLMVVEYSQNTDFPIVKTIDDPRNFTFAIFGKNSTHFDERPVVNGSEGNTGQETNILGIIIGIIVGVVAIVIVAVVIFALVVHCCCHKRRTQNGNGEDRPPRTCTGGLCCDGAEMVEKDGRGTPVLEPEPPEPEPPNQAEACGAVREKDNGPHYSSSSGKVKAGIGSYFRYDGAKELRRRPLAPHHADMWRQDGESSG